MGWWFRCAHTFLGERWEHDSVKVEERKRRLLIKGFRFLSLPAELIHLKLFCQAGNQCGKGVTLHKLLPSYNKNSWGFPSHSTKEGYSIQCRVKCLDKRQNHKGSLKYNSNPNKKAQNPKITKGYFAWHVLGANNGPDRQVLLRYWRDYMSMVQIKPFKMPNDFWLKMYFTNSNAEKILC